MLAGRYVPALLLLLAGAGAPEPATAPTPSATERTYTCYVLAIDVDTRQRMDITIRPEEDAHSSFKMEKQSNGTFKVEFRSRMIEAQPMPVSCEAEAKGYRSERFQLESTDKLMTVYMESLHPTVHTWREEKFAYIHDLVSRTDPGAAKEMNAVLNDGAFLKKFQETYWYREPWQIEAEYLSWQQWAALDAAKNPTFGEALAKYYFGDADKAAKLSAEEQIRMAALKQIEEGSLWVKELKEGWRPMNIGYSVGKIVYAAPDRASVDCSFNAPLAGRGYQVELMRTIAGGVDVWFPMKKNPTWVSCMRRTSDSA